MKYKTFKRIKTVLIAVLITVFALSLCGCEEAQDASSLRPTDEFFVNDFAGVIDETAKTEILSRSAALDAATKAQVVVATVKSTGDTEISEFALELGRNWEIGDSELNNGILILLASEDRQVYIAVGYGLEGAMPDSKTGRIIDRYGIEYFKNDEFSAGLLSVYKAVVNEVYIEYGMEAEEGYIPINMMPAEQNEESGLSAAVGISWAILIVLINIYLLFCRKRYGIVFYHGGNFRGGGFGGFGGSSGGGFGGFSGGGGSFGGGGAGRGF